MVTAMRLLFPWMFLALTGTVAAHPALYHYVEINLHEPGEVRIYVTVHAPELSDQVRPLEEDVFGAEWLATLDDETIAELVANAQRFGDEKFAFHFGERRAEIALHYPSAELIRHPPADSAVPAGCFSGEAEMRYQTSETALSLDFSALADKRLMLVINRPGAFPEVSDIEPGTSVRIPLPAAPPPPVPEAAKGPWKGQAITAAIVGMLIFWLVRRRRGRQQRV